jgi:protoheme IX farnesyltransferase
VKYQSIMMLTGHSARRVYPIIATDPSCWLCNYTGTKLLWTPKNRFSTQNSLQSESYKNTATGETSSITASRKSSKWQAYSDLAKAKLSALVVATTCSGFLAAGPLASETTTATFLAVLSGTALCASSAAALNQMLEVPRDRNMKRTQHRPLINGSLSMTSAGIAAFSWGTAGSTILYFGTDPVTTVLGVSNIALYAGLYTYLKPRTILNTWVGAAVGAVPPIMGYTAATATATAVTTTDVLAQSCATLALDPTVWALGGTLYLWQLPHFMSLAYMYRTDYARGGFQMIPVVDETNQFQTTADVIVRYAWYLSTIPIFTTAMDITGSMFALEGCLLNAYALTVAYRFHRERTNANARKIFLTSLWYLPCLLSLFLLHSRKWDIKEENNIDQHCDATNICTQYIQKIRNTGRELCVHERVIANQEKSVQNPQEACPIILSKEHGREAAQTAVQVATELSSEKLVLQNDTSSDKSTRLRHGNSPAEARED